MKLLLVNGPNINILNKRSSLYGNNSYKDIKIITRTKGVNIKYYQYNSEEKIINILQKYLNKVDGLILNLAAFTHTSIAIRDIVELYSCKKVEVHITDIYNREDFRKINYIKDIVDKSIVGKGIQGYKEAVEYLKKNI